MKLNSEIAGTIWKIEKGVGDAVTTGETILIIESMKMEIPVEAPEAGRVVTVLVEEGEMVEEGQALVELGA